MDTIRTHREGKMPANEEDKLNTYNPALKAVDLSNTAIHPGHQYRQLNRNSYHTRN
jgi:hypothetical protein